MQDPIIAEPSAPAQEQIGFPVSAKKFWIMSILTGSLYRLYWAYQNFRHLNISANNAFGASVYSIILPITLSAMIGGVEKTAAERGVSVQLSKLRLSLTYFGLSAVAGLVGYFVAPILGVLIGFVALIPVYHVQKKINAVNAQLHPDLLPSGNFTPWDIVGMVIGCFLIFANIMAAFSSRN